MWANDYVGLPFAENGRLRSTGVDCWGLYRLVMIEQNCIVLPMYDTVDMTDTLAVRGVMMEEAHGPTWHQVPGGIECAHDFDCVLMRSVFMSGERYTAGNVHVGCFVAPGFVLHIEKRIDAMLQPFRDLSHRIAGVFRHREMMGLH